MSFHPPVPILRMFDEAKAREFYLRYLGFEVAWEHRFDAGMPLYMEIRRGACVIHLSEHHGDGTPGTTIRIRVDELEAYHAELVAKNYKYYRPGLQDQEWGTREMTVQDGCGNKLVFYRPLETSRTVTQPVV
ncbi:MAG TPA: glyoxalase superfamily protein [Kofleriaceae bacterium]|nr:glyoxalase superfamily protein [Kofleriaceae bacterium]